MHLLSVRLSYSWTSGTCSSTCTVMGRIPVRMPASVLHDLLWPCATWTSNLRSRACVPRLPKTAPHSNCQSRRIVQIMYMRLAAPTYVWYVHLHGTRTKYHAKVGVNATLCLFEFFEPANQVLSSVLFGCGLSPLASWALLWGVWVNIGISKWACALRC